MEKICYFNRSAVHYRLGVYRALDSELNVDFYFGDSRPGNIKPIDYKLLKNFKSLLHNIVIGPCYWQIGALSLLRKYNVFITTGDTYCLSTWLFLVFAKLFRKQVFLWTIGAMGDEKTFEKLVIRFKSALATGSMLYGNRGKELLLKYGVNPSKLTVIYNSLSYDDQFEIRKNLAKTDIYKKHFNNNNRNVVFIGRLAKRRKLEMIVHAMEILDSEKVPINVTYLGEGPAREDIINNCTDRNRVWLYGEVYDERVISEFIYNADLLVSPGSIGLTAMHALTYGCPVITHNNFCNLGPEHEAITKGLNGDFFEENNVESLAATIKMWFESHPDRDSMRQKCFMPIDNIYNPHNQVTIIKNFINKF